MNSKLFYFKYLLFALILCSCGKEDYLNVNDANLSNDKPVLRVTSGNNPILEDGVYYFQDLIEANEYIQNLQSEIDESDDRAQFIINHYSDNDAFKSMYEKLDNDGFYTNFEKGFTKEEILNYLSKDWISGDAKKLLINENGELGIGNEIFVWFSNDLIYSFPKENIELREMLISEPRDIRIPSIEIFRQNPKIMSSYISKGLKSFTSHGPPPGNSADLRDLTTIGDVRFGTFSEVDNCNGLTVHINAIMEVVTGLDGAGGDIWEIYSDGGTMTFDFGDGNVEIIDIESGSETGQYRILHQYSSSGSYTATVTFDYVDIDGIEQSISDDILLFLNEGCTNERSREPFFEDNGNRAMSGFLKLSADAFGIQWVAKTIGHRIRPNGTWRRTRGALTVEGSATFRNVSDCSVSVENEEDDDCGNCRDIRAAKNAAFFVWERNTADGDVRSRHAAEFSSAVGSPANPNVDQFEIEIVLNPCQ